jgi:hypothetical protein
MNIYKARLARKQKVAQNEEHGKDEDENPFYLNYYAVMTKGNTYCNRRLTSCTAMIIKIPL